MEIDRNRYIQLLKMMEFIGGRDYRPISFNIECFYIILNEIKCELFWERLNNQDDRYHYKETRT